MSKPRYSHDEHAAASVVASLSTSVKRRHNEAMAVGTDDVPSEKPEKPKIRRTGTSGASQDEDVGPLESRELRPAPFFYYRDFSRMEDDDPLTPLTPPGRVPNFPAKMHAILSRPDFAHIIAWAPHGRSFRVLKPRQFEVQVIPTYFEHSKFSSYVRQANGWGFRRQTQGPDRNCYYHEMFLRGMPHLCKKMKRPGASGKLSADPEHEPDLYKISELYPIRDCAGGAADNQAILLQCTVEGGPKARMPVHMGLQLNAVPQQTQGECTEFFKEPCIDKDDRKVAAKRTAEELLAPKDPPQPTQPFVSPANTSFPSSVSIPLCGASFASHLSTEGTGDQKMAAKMPRLAPKPVSKSQQSRAPEQGSGLPGRQPSYGNFVPCAQQNFQPPAAAPLPPAPSTLSSTVSPLIAAASLAIKQQQLSQQLAATQQAQAAVQAQATALASELAGKIQIQQPAALPAPRVPAVPGDTAGAQQFAAGFAAAAALSSGAIQAVLQQAFGNTAAMGGPGHMSQSQFQPAVSTRRSQMPYQPQASGGYPYTNFQHMGLPPKDPSL